MAIWPNWNIDLTWAAVDVNGNSVTFPRGAKMNGCIQPNAGGPTFYMFVAPQPARATTPSGAFNFPGGYWSASVGSQTWWNPNPHPQATLEAILLPPGQAADDFGDNIVIKLRTTGDSGVLPLGVFTIAFAGDLNGAAGTVIPLGKGTMWQQFNSATAMDTLLLQSGTITRTY